MATRSSSTNRRRTATGRRLIADQRRSATVQWLALAVVGFLAVLAAFVLLSGNSTVLNP